MVVSLFGTVKLQTSKQGNQYAQTPFSILEANVFLFPTRPLLPYLILAMHASHALRQADHGLELSHSDAPGRLGGAGAVSLA